MTTQTPYVITIKDRCKVCYTCVRECPAKAIRIINGQAEIQNERCISCGNCVKVCSQKAKQSVSSIAKVENLLHSSYKVGAIIAPSIAAEFMDISDYQILVGMIRKLGFTYVNEVAFGAELVAEKYKQLLQEGNHKTLISTSCPAIVSFIEKYHGQIVHSLSPVVSPMIATAKVVHHLHGDDVKLVFIGPCTAKKAEAEKYKNDDKVEVDEVLTFIELRQLFQKYGVTADNVTLSDFDPPYARKGNVFPISGGMLQTVDLEEDFLKGEIVVADGRQSIIEVLKEFEEGFLDAKFFDLLCCHGCINGAGMSNKEQFFSKRKSVSNFAKRMIDRTNEQNWAGNFERFSTLDLSTSFVANNQKIETPPPAEIVAILHKLGKKTPDDELNCGACGYDTCREHAIAIYRGLAESEMCLPYTIEELHNYIKQLDISNSKLASTQLALRQSEKLASMGQLAAGIAHEVNNPLGVVIMYSHILLDELDPENPMYKDLQLIVEQADRCKKIVGGLLNFARKSKVNLTTVNVKQLIDCGLNAVIINDNVTIKVNINLEKPEITVDVDQMTQVFANLLKNAIDAMPNGGTIYINCFEENNEIVFEVKDTGIGIAPENMDKLFEPFFTTKEQGKGTGLGLPIIYGIVKMHRGNIKVESNQDKNKGEVGTKFTVRLPRIQ